MKNKRVLLGVLIVIGAVAAAAGGYWLARHGSHGPAQSTAMDGERRPLFYRHPMNPEITSPVPAKDEMGMDYVPVYADEEVEGAPGTVRIDPTTVQNIGVRTAAAERRVLARTVRTVGRVAYNEEGLARLYPKTEGWIEKLYVNKTGEPVRRGDALLRLYAPQLVASQQEYLIALNNLRTLGESSYTDARQGADRLVKAARERLLLLDVPEAEIRRLEESHKVSNTLPLASRFDGVVVNVGVRSGQYVTPTTELYQIADLRTVWVLADIYENELPWVRVGDVAEMRVAGLPGRTFRGTVGYIYPYLVGATRTTEVRLEFDNRDLALKPDMFAEVTIRAGQQIDVVTVPAEAVLRSGARNRVFVEREPGVFEPRQVILGVESDGLLQVTEGVKAGEKVVVSAQFLIDSESQIREAAAKMRPPDAGVAMAGDMEDMATSSNGMAKTAKGTGMVTAIDKRAGTITIDHGPIPEVDWPAMTMAFKARPGLLETVKVGDEIAFDFELENGAAELTAIRTHGGMKGP